MYEESADALGEATLPLREVAVAAFVSALVNLLGWRELGFPMDQMVYWPLYLATFVGSAVGAAILVAGLIKLFEISNGMGKTVLNAIVTALVSFVLLTFAHAIAPVEPAAQPSNVPPGPPTTSAPPPVESPSPTKAAQPGNTDLCDPGTGAIFSSLAADLGRQGRGAAGTAHWTSCPFAQEVRRAYNNQVGLGNYGTVAVVSPVVPQNGPIPMTCAPRSDNMIICEGGKDAKMYVY